MGWYYATKELLEGNPGSKKIGCKVCGEPIEEGRPMYFLKIMNGKVEEWCHFRCVDDLAKKKVPE